MFLHSNNHKIFSRYFKRPPNRRVNYNKLAITSPFRCPWSELVDQWSVPSNAPESTSFFVLREHAKLQQITHCLQQRGNIDHLNLPANCLLPVSIDIAGRGNAEKYAIICLPKKSDLKREQRAQRNLINVPIYTEPQRNDSNETKRKSLRAKHMQLLKRLRRQRVRKKRRLQETSERKVVLVKASTAELVEKQRTAIQELWLHKWPENVRNQCSRDVIGYLTQAHFSFIKAKSAGVGYITTNGFRQLLNFLQKQQKGPNYVLVRCPATAHYRKAIIQIRSN